MRLRPNIQSARTIREQGSLLIIVLWISFGLVALTLYFAHSMSLELRAADNRTATVESSEAINGAARYVSNILGTLYYPGYMPNPLDIRCDAVAVGEAKFWLIGRETNDWVTSVARPAFGLVDESSKLNLNAPWLSAEMIEYLPGMTLQIAAAIMDWRDSDSSLSENGAEDETYSKLSPPYRAKNAPFESVEELRLVAGMTTEILYGEDANLNGVLDPNENDGDLSPPYDNRDGYLDPGLMEYFTVYSYEPMMGTNISSRADLTALFETILGEARATEIMAQPGMAGTAFNNVRSVLGLYLSSGMTEDEFALVDDYLAPATNYTVNVNTASQAVLECIPGIGFDYAAQLVTYRESNPSRLGSVAWVLEAMGQDEESARAAGPYITTQSYQYMADVAAVGRYNRGYQRVRFVFDTSEGAPIIVRRQDLTQLGWALGKDTRTELLTAKVTQ